MGKAVEFMVSGVRYTMAVTGIVEEVNIAGLGDIDEILLEPIEYRFPRRLRFLVSVVIFVVVESRILP